jgi:methylamine dehydrogenase accessory protein MauD
VTRIRRAQAITTFWLLANLGLWFVVLFLGFLLWGALRALALLRWRLDELEAITPRRVGRSGLRPGKKAPDFRLPTLSGSEVALHNFAGHKLLLVFMQPGCGPCRHITPELSRLYRAGEIQVLVIHNADTEAVQEWVKHYRPDFSVALQERFEVSRRYEVFATPFAFLIDERGVIVARGIISTKQYLGFVLTRAGQGDKEVPSEAESSGESHRLAAAADEPSLSSSKEADHV